MRNRSFSISIDFSWTVARSGYRWITEAGEQYLCAVDAFEKPDWPGLPGRYHRSYRPLEERTGLFRELAELKPTKAQILAFANRCGQLDRLANLECSTTFGLRRVRGEKLEDWKKEIRALKEAVTLWDTIASGKKEELVASRAKLDLPLVPLAARRRLHLDQADPAVVALGMIQRATDSYLQEHVAARFIFFGDDPRLRVCLEPKNLLGSSWLQFAASVDGLKNFAKCPQCGTPFEISRDAKTGKRVDARFCSARCRVNHYRGRIEQARRMHAAGRSHTEIARKLKSQVSTVKGWLPEGERGRPRDRES
jgi:hypothetical protein